MTAQRKVITAEPENSETPLEAVRSWVTPTPWFFVRNHFDVPELDSATWRLVVGGLVERPLELSWDELNSMPERSVFVTMECAGNGRSFLEPRPAGVPWGAGAVAHAEWTGVPLHVLLEEAGLKPEVIEVLFEGADRGTESDHPEPMHFVRSLPLEKAFHPETLLALRMNGEVLAPSHGFPARLIVPGWYGVASVKWLERIEAIAQPFRGYFQNQKYTTQRRTDRGTESVIVQGMTVKSEILRPHAEEVLGLGTNRLFGVAWAGEEAVAEVNVSTDAGRTWRPARLIGPQAAYSWTLWEYLWEVAVPGTYSLLARATSSGGAVQPLAHDPLAGGYLIHHSRATRVQVEGTRRTKDQPGDADTLVYDMNAYAEENARFPLDIELEFAQGGGI